MSDRITTVSCTRRGFQTNIAHLICVVLFPERRARVRRKVYGAVHDSVALRRIQGVRGVQPWRSGGSGGGNRNGGG